MKYLNQLLEEFKEQNDDWKIPEAKHLETREGLTDKQKANFNSVYRDLVSHSDRKAGAIVHADRTPIDYVKNLHKHGAASIIGSVANDHHDLATIAQVYRDPRLEHLHMIYTKGNQIVSHHAVSSRMPGSVTAFPILPVSETTGRRDHEKQHILDMRNIQGIQDHMKSVGADGYWMVHNHPSGNPIPSSADHTLSHYMAEKVPGFKGHVVIDHDKFAHISPESTDLKSEKFRRHEIHDISNSHLYHKFDYDQYHMNHDLIEKGHEINGKNDAVEIAKHFEHPDHSVLIGRQADGRVNAIASFPAQLLHYENNRSEARIKRFRESTGSCDVVIATNPRHYDKTADHFRKNNNVLTVIDHVNRKSIAENEYVRPEGIKERNKRYGQLSPNEEREL